MYTGPHIITDGLILSLDAGNPKSYPGSGITWIDKSGFGNNGTLINGPTFNTSNGGGISFDGVNDYVNISDRSYSITNPITLNLMFKLSSNSINSFLSQPLIAWGPARIYVRNSTNDVFIRTENDLSAYQVFYSLGNNNFSINNVCTIYTGWNGSNYSLRIYNNGILLSENIFTSAPSLDFKYYLGLFSNRGTLTGAFNGIIHTVQVYNRVLTSQEIQQNYNAIKTRYGL